MKRRDFLAAAAALPAAYALPRAAYAQQLPYEPKAAEKWRTFEVVTKVEVQKPQGVGARLGAGARGRRDLAAHRRQRVDRQCEERAARARRQVRRVDGRGRMGAGRRRAGAHRHQPVRHPRPRHHVGQADPVRAPGPGDQALLHRVDRLPAHRRHRAPDRARGHQGPRQRPLQGAGRSTTGSWSTPSATPRRAAAASAT